MPVPCVNVTILPFATGSASVDIYPKGLEAYG